MTTCECKEMSCKEGCTRNHTCKKFFCEKCEPVERRKMLEPIPVPKVCEPKKGLREVILKDYNKFIAKQVNLSPREIKLFKNFLLVSCCKAHAQGQSSITEDPFYTARMDKMFPKYMDKARADIEKEIREYEYNRGLSDNKKKGQAYRDGFEVGFGDGRQSILDDLNHEQQKFLDGFGHPRDCQFCKKLLDKK